ncbi:MAG: hypothetical protein WBG50_06050, partial [Desulfomonilaceae bacterium]
TNQLQRPKRLNTGQTGGGDSLLPANGYRIFFAFVPKDLYVEEKLAKVLKEPVNACTFEPFKTNEALKMLAIKDQPIDIPQPTLHNSEQCHRTMLSSRSLSQIDLLHDSPN